MYYENKMNQIRKLFLFENELLDFSAIFPYNLLNPRKVLRYFGINHRGVEEMTFVLVRPMSYD